MLNTLNGNGVRIKVNVSKAKIENTDAMVSQIKMEREYAFKFLFVCLFKDQKKMKNKFTMGTINKS